MKSNVEVARKRRERKWTSNVAILCGAAVLLATGGTELYNSMQRRAAEADFALQMQQMEAAALTSAAQATPTVPEPTPGEGTPWPTHEMPRITGNAVPTMAPIGTFDVLGILTIDSMGLTVPVVEGTGTDQLHVTVGHMTNSPLPGRKGNVAIAGHRSGVAAKPFVHLDYVKVGDTVKFFDGATTYDYLVFKTFVVKADENWVLRPVDEAPYCLTLISCYYPLFGPTERLIVQGRLQGT
jgi:sortase A